MWCWDPFHHRSSVSQRQPPVSSQTYYYQVAAQNAAGQ